MTGPDELRARVLAGVASHPARTRAQGRRRALALYAAAAATMVGIFEYAGGFGHAASRPAWISTWLVLGLSVIASVGAWGGLGSGGSMTGRRSAALGLVVLLLPAAVFVWLTTWYGSYPEPAQKFGWRCLGLTLSMGGAVLASVVAVRKRTVVVRPVLQGAAMGVAAGGCAAVLVDAWCPLVNSGHVIRGHIVPMLALALAGAACGKLLLAISPRR